MQNRSKELINTTQENVSSTRILTSVPFPNFLDAQILKTVDKPISFGKSSSSLIVSKLSGIISISNI